MFSQLTDFQANAISVTILSNLLLQRNHKLKTSAWRTVNIKDIMLVAKTEY